MGFKEPKEHSQWQDVDEKGHKEDEKLEAWRDHMFGWWQHRYQVPADPQVPAGFFLSPVLPCPLISLSIWATPHEAGVHGYQCLAPPWYEEQYTDHIDK